ncbi:MAG TPA: hypothetical protein VKF81_15200 [Blastocatellia bacterium]|nr:hypothetical protein [Blastocatellia bacterium]
MRPAYDWIPRINEKQKRLADLKLSAEEKNRIDRRLEAEFVYSTLELRGAGVSRASVAQLISSEAHVSVVGEVDQSAFALLLSLRAVSSRARSRGTTAALTADLLVQLHGAPGESASLAERAVIAVDAACRWFAADSFSELHPVEQASIVLLRLIDIRPFEQLNEQTALVAASLFTLRSELPPIIVRPQSQIAYRAALDEGDQMNTKPMVEFVAESVERSLSEIIQNFE